MICQSTIGRDFLRQLSTVRLELRPPISVRYMNKINKSITDFIVYLFTQYCCKANQASGVIRSKERKDMRIKQLAGKPEEMTCA